MCSTEEPKKIAKILYCDKSHKLDSILWAPWKKKTVVLEGLDYCPKYVVYHCAEPQQRRLGVWSCFKKKSIRFVQGTLEEYISLKYCNTRLLHPSNVYFYLCRIKKRNVIRVYNLNWKHLSFVFRLQMEWFMSRLSLNHKNCWLTLGQSFPLRVIYFSGLLWE